MGRQYVRQSFSSASSAAGDSPCASSTTLQCVVANGTAPFCTFPPIAVNDVASSSAAHSDTSKKARSKIKHRFATQQCRWRLGILGDSAGGLPACRNIDLRQSTSGKLVCRVSQD